MSNRRYSLTFPPKGRQLFDGGKNNKFERSIILDNESPDCANVMFSNGAVETVFGMTKLNTTAVGSFVGDGIYTRHADTGAETMIVFAGGSAWQLTGNSTFTTIASAQSVFTAGVRVAAAEYQNHMFIGNGGVTPYKYNGTDFTRHGVPAPTATMSAATAGSGTALTGDLMYTVTYVNSASVEGDIGPATTTLTVAGQNVALTGIPTAPQSHGVAARRLYRSSDGGATWERVVEISDNTTTTYDDAITTLGADAPTDNGEPPTYSVCVYHANRLFCNDVNNPNYVWWSEIGEPYTFKATSFQKVGDATSDLVKTLEVYNGSLLIGCSKSATLLVMPDATPANWSPIRLRSRFGSKSPFGAFSYRDQISIPAMDGDKFVGFASIAGAQLDPNATYLENGVVGSELSTERIEPDMFLVQESYVGNISSIVFKNKAYVALTYGNGNSANNRIYVFDFSISNLSKKQKFSWVPITGINAAQFTVYDGKLFFVSSAADGFVYQFDETIYNFDGSAIDSYFWTKEFSGLAGHENLTKDWRTIQLLVEKAGAYFMNVSYRVDSDKGVGKTEQISLDPGGSIWGTMRFGIDEWGGGDDQEEITLTLGQTRGKRIQLKFSNQNVAGQRFKIHGMNLTYNLKGKR